MCIRDRLYYDYSRYNEGRLPAFAQLDLRIDKAFYFRRCTLGIYVDLQNVTGSKLRQPDVLMSTGIEMCIRDRRSTGRFSHL